MPELPDVEIFKQYLDATALHQNIKQVQILKPDILEGISASKFQKAMAKKSFSATTRYGKNLLVHMTGNNALRFHFGMTGSLKYYKRGNDEMHHVCIRFDFTNGYMLNYMCQRLLGKVTLEKSVRDFIETNKLGLDALDITTKDFQSIVQGSKKVIKSLLMDQKKIAGLGNIYTDEILFQSGIHPETRSNKLSDKNIKTIYKSIHQTCEYAIHHRANPDQFGKSYLLAKRKKNGHCPKCDAKLKQAKISGRTTYYCPYCQSKKS